MSFLLEHQYPHMCKYHHVHVPDYFYVLCKGNEMNGVWCHDSWFFDSFKYQWEHVNKVLLGTNATFKSY